jgi:hypothetical protein
MDIEASAVARRAEGPAEVRMIGLRPEPEPRPSFASSTGIPVNVVDAVATVAGVAGGGRAEWWALGWELTECKLDTTLTPPLSMGSRATVELSERQKYEGLARVSIPISDA